MTNSNTINNAFILIKNHFKNTRLLSFDELLFLMEQSENWNTQDIPLISDWYDDFIEMKYLDQAMKADACDIHIGELQYFQDNKNNQTPLTRSIESKFKQLHFEILCHQNNITWNFSQPFVSFRTLIGGNMYRATLTHRSISPNLSSSLFLRKINNKPFPISNFAPSKLQKVLVEMLSHKKNILICGATGSGKTSFLSSLMQYIPDNEHTIILEDTKELIPPNNTTELLAVEKPLKGLVDFCHYALRMSPERLVIGEMRAKEIVPYLLMMNTGHNGLMSTIHANSAVDAIHRCAFLFTIHSDKQQLSYEDILKLVSNSVDYVVYLKNKSVDHIIEVLGSEKRNCFFETIYDVLPTPSNLDQREIFL